MTGGVSAAVREAAAARRNERELDRFPYGREGRVSARVGKSPAEGRPLLFAVLPGSRHLLQY